MIVDWLIRQIQNDNWRLFIRSSIVIWLLSLCHAIWVVWHSVQDGLPWQGVISAFCGGAAIGGIFAVLGFGVLRSVREREITAKKALEEKYTGLQARYDELSTRFKANSAETVRLAEQIKQHYGKPTPESA